MVNWNIPPRNKGKTFKKPIKFGRQQYASATKSNISKTFKTTRASIANTICKTLSRNITIHAMSLEDPILHCPSQTMLLESLMTWLRLKKQVVFPETMIICWKQGHNIGRQIIKRISVITHNSIVHKASRTIKDKATIWRMARKDYSQGRRACLWGRIWTCQGQRLKRRNHTRIDRRLITARQALQTISSIMETG